MPKTVIAYDLARTYGWAEGEPGGVPRFGSARIAPPGSPSPDLFGNAIGEFGRRLFAFPPRAVIFESPSLFQLKAGKSTPATARVLLALPGILEGVAKRAGVPIIKEVAAPTVRKFFIGHGGLPRAKAKAAVIAECKRRGWDVRNDDEADACALWAYMCAVLEPELQMEGPETPLLRTR